MQILGKITDDKNIALLKQSFEAEVEFNNPDIAFVWVIQRYYDNGQKYGTTNLKGDFVPRPLYEREPQSELKFIDVDVFRQAALHFKKHGVYTKLHPEYDRLEYQSWYDREEYRRKNGMTAWAGIDKEGKRRKVYINSEMYGFLNYGPIKRTADDTDITEEDLNKASKKQISKETTIVADLMKKISAVSVVSKTIDFPDFFDAQYHISTARAFAKRIGKNFFYGKARRKGQSYWNAWCAFNNADLNPFSTTAQVASDLKYLNTGEKALFNMTKSYADHIWEHTDWGKHRQKDTNSELSFGYKLKGENIKRGYQSEILALSAMNNPDCLIGKDTVEAQFEEMGKFPNFVETYDVTVSATEAGDNIVGFLTGWGTGGTKDANWAAFEEVCYNPDSFNILACNNVWDEGAEGTPCCYFYAHVDGLEGHMDYNGNTNFKTAWDSHVKKKEIKRLVSATESSFMRWCGQRANSPSEAFARDSNNIFPTEEIQAQLNFVTRNKHINDARRCGVLVPNNKYGVILKTNDELRAEGKKVHEPLDEFPRRKGTDPHGCIVEYQSPWRDVRGKVPDGLYIAFQDPYGVDKTSDYITTKNSVAATYIIQLPNKYTGSKGGMIVASYIGRPERQDDYNQQVLYLLQRYNAKLMFENDRGDVIPFMRKKKALHLLCKEPEMQFAKDISGKAGRGYGMHMTPARLEKGVIYLRDHLLEVINKDTSSDKPRTFLSYIYDAALLKELLKWNKKGNFDRVSAMIIGEYIIKEVEHIERAAPKAYQTNSIFNRPLF